MCVYLEEGMATHSSILAWRIPWTEELGRLSPWGCKESDVTERLSTCVHMCNINVCTYRCIHIYRYEILFLWGL